MKIYLRNRRLDHSGMCLKYLRFNFELNIKAMITNDQMASFLRFACCWFFLYPFSWACHHCCITFADDVATLKSKMILWIIILCDWLQHYIVGLVSSERMFALSLMQHLLVFISIHVVFKWCVCNYPCWPIRIILI